ncbi:zinc finger protein 343-like [Manduca sexta]|uniref:zinc finger protein 343-like n=1 Tax=Manduca sexta TaxID=7130 RepID=UPI00188E03E1|nr:zinc finger protein 343-like [Manduca sexta]
MCDNIQNCCRICLAVDADRVPILGDPTICLQLKSCLTMSVSSLDHLPKEICMSCVSQLNQFYKFQINARCSQDWLESSLQEMLKKNSETKTPIQPLPDSEYNSDSLLEFLNNTANIEEYLNNLGREDIPSIVNMLDRNEQATEVPKVTNLKTIKNSSPTKDKIKSCKKLKIDILDSDVDIVKGIIQKETDSKIKTNSNKTDKNFTCFACKTKFENIQKLSQHLSVCDTALRTCMQCHALFDSKLKLNQHMLTHTTSLSCNCGEQFLNKPSLIQHRKTCQGDLLAGFIFRCKECGDSFKDRFQLYRHAKDHLLKVQHRICDICGHTFVSEETLLEHKKEEHEKSVNSMYRCKVCSYISADHKEIFIHVKKHTERPEPHRHLCESCGRSFATRASLIRHSQQHDQNRIKCRICGATFSGERELEVHVLEHVEMVMCERCGQTVINYKLNEHRC